jgi:hypothetical protein
VQHLEGVVHEAAIHDGVLDVGIDLGFDAEDGLFNELTLIIMIMRE